MKNALFTIGLLLISATYAQEYFQQEVNYKMDVSLDDVNHEITAFEEIEYHNNSKVVIDTVFFHLWPNAYKNKKTALAQQILKDGQTNFHYANNENRGYIDQLDFKVNDQRVVWEYWNGNEDIVILILNKPLNPGTKIQISTPFHVKIPLGVYSRLGHLGESYQMTQWYPKPAVFDANGWNPISYLSQGEFYSEFGTYDVSITLPKNYVVGATGDLQNEKEIAWLDSLSAIGLKKYSTNIEEEEATSDESSKLKTSNNLETENDTTLNFPASDKELKTIRYTQSNVHDFAWFADKRFHVLSGEVELPNTGKKVKTWAMFTDRHAEYWKDAIEYINDGLYYYSKWNGDYPYEHCTAVDGALTAGGGMEYPNITVIGSVESARSLETVIVHEVGHNWFYGILGSNEREFPWMDEGINSFNEYRYIKTKYPSNFIASDSIVNSALGKLVGLNEYKHREENYLLYLLNASEGLDQACGLHSCKHTPLNYGIMVYTKTALAFEYLQAYLGEEVLDRAMHNYFETWKFKHPQPKDLQESLEKSTTKNLDWFFNELINTNKKIDYSIAKVTSFEDYVEVEIKNKGNIKSPISISAFKDRTVYTTKWLEGFSKTKTLKIEGTGLTKFVLDEKHCIPEINRQNNFYNTQSIFPKIEPLDIDPLWSLEQASKTQVFLSPYLNFNFADKIILGLSIHNKQLIRKPFSYSITPAYSTGQNELIGLASLRYSYLPYSNIFRLIELSSSVEQFNYNASKMYTKAAGKLKINFAKNPGNAPNNHQLTLRVHSITKDESSDYIISDLTHSYKYKHTLKTVELNTKLQFSKEFTKLSLENVYRYKTKKRGNYQLRLFGGVFLNETKNNDFHFGLVQQKDYLFEYGILDRAGRDNVLSNQITTTDGGFVLGNQYMANNYLLSANLQVPLLKPIKGYFNIANISTNGKNSSHLDSGLILTLIPKRMEIYFPVYLPEGANTEHYESNIRFLLNVNIQSIVDEIRVNF